MPPVSPAACLSQLNERTQHSCQTVPHDCRNQRLPELQLVPRHCYEIKCLLEPHMYMYKYDMQANVQA